MNRLINLAILCVTTAIVFSSNCAAADAISIEIPLRTKPVDFGTDIAPILRANCVACHNEKKANGSLNLESPQTILKGGDQGPAVVAGKGTESLLLKVAAHQKESVMPPPDNTVKAKPLTSIQLGLLKLWIDQGATGSVSTTRNIQWQPMPAGYQPALATAVTPDGQYAACSRGNRLSIYHMASAKLATMLVDPGLASTPGGPDTNIAHRDLVRCLAFDATGDLLASGSYREVKLWRRPRVTRAAEWTHDAAVQSVAASADARWAATGDESGRIRIWEISSGKSTQSFVAHPAAVTGIVFSLDGTVVFSSSLDKLLRAWNVATGESIGTGVETPSPTQGLTLVNKGQWLVTGGQDGIARVWDVTTVRSSNGETVKPLQEIKAHEGAITALTSFSGNELEFFTGGADGQIRRWNAQSGMRLAELRNEGPVVALAVSPDGRRIVSAGANVVTFWGDDGKTIAQLKDDPRETAKIARLEAEAKFTKASIAHAQQDLKSYEGLIRIAMVRIEDIKKAEEEVTKAQKTRDEKKAALEKVKSENGKPEAAEKALADAETAVVVFMTVVERAKAISERTAKELAAAEQDVKAREELLKQQEVNSAAAVTAAKAIIPVIRSLAFIADGRQLAIGCEAGMIHVYDAETGSWSESRTEHQGAVRAMCSTSAGQLVTGSADRKAAVWNATSQWKLERVIGTQYPQEVLADRVLSLDFSRDGQWLATGGGIPSRSGELKIWQVADGRLIRDVKDAHSETVFAVRFSPDGKHLASAAGDRFIKLFDTKTGDIVRRMAGHTGNVLALSWKSDGKMLISSGADNVLKLWDVERGVPLRTMKGSTYQIGAYKREVTAAAFIGDSEQILAASGDGTVRLHRTTSDGDILTFAGSKGYQFAVAATPDGKYVIATGSDGTLRIWSGHEQQPKQTLSP
ncbi:MAG: Planctomycete cytochrome [Planctomycetaceae bacterium]|nr:Planctomycete cytochrome [Planctomycetaceae bacterium]